MQEAAMEPAEGGLHLFPQAVREAATGGGGSSSTIETMGGIASFRKVDLQFKSQAFKALP